MSTWQQRRHASLIIRLDYLILVQEILLKIAIVVISMQIVRVRLLYVQSYCVIVGCNGTIRPSFSICGIRYNGVKHIYL